MSDRISSKDLPYDGFEASDLKLEKWKLGNSITRENFASFLEQSFRLSRGSVNAQAMTRRDLSRFGFLSEMTEIVQSTLDLTPEETNYLYKRYSEAQGVEHKRRNDGADRFLASLDQQLFYVEELAKRPLEIWVNIILTLYKRDVRLALRNALKIRKILEKKSLEAEPVCCKPPGP